MLQDDVCALLPDGSAPGSEGKGLFIKTIGLDEDEQPALYEAATDESAILENVAVDDDGAVDFDEPRYTSNARAIIQRDELSSAADEIDLDRVPGHVAIIMDGNGRWANQRGLPRNAGHEAGESALFDTVEGALELGIRDLTVYAFSTENWRRPAEEVRFLLGFNESLLVRRADELHDRGVRVRFIGRRGRPVPRRLVKLIERTEQLTRSCDRMTLRIAFNYGSRAELVDAANELADDVAAGRLRRVDERSLAARLHDPRMPDVDLLIRTSGEVRLSNFLLWQAAYAELVFTETLWPDFDRVALRRCIEEFQRRDRRYGGAVDAPEGS